MATRYYTNDAYEQIKQTIEQIDNADVNPVKDFFSDLFMRLLQFMKYYSLEQYREDIQSWYNIVLDSHNTTLGKVDSIFNSVDSVDFEYRDIMNEAVDSIVNYRATLNCLRDVISGKTSLADGKTAAEGYLAAGTKSLNASYNTVLAQMEATTLMDASKQLMGDAFKFGLGFLSLLVPASPAEYSAKCKSFLDTCVATLNDLGAIGTIGLTALVGCAGVKLGLKYENYLDFRFGQLIEAQEYKDTNSVSDWLGGISVAMKENLEDCDVNNPYYSVVHTAANISEGAYAVSNTVDVTADVIDIASGIQSSFDDVDGWINGKEYTVGEFADEFAHKSFYDWEIVGITDGKNGTIIKVKGTPSGIVKTIISNWTGLPISDWGDPSKLDGNLLKTFGTLWSYGEKFIPDPVGGWSSSDEMLDVFIGKTKDGGNIKKVIDFVRDYLVTEVS